VDHERPRRDIGRLGAYLDWQGGLPLDYLFDGTSATCIEGNPRTVVPGNVVASSVDVPELQVRTCRRYARLSLNRRGGPGLRTLD